MDVEVNKLTII